MCIYSYVINRSSYPSSLFHYAINLYLANPDHSTLLNIGRVEMPDGTVTEKQNIHLPLERHFYLSGMMGSFPSHNFLRKLPAIEENPIVHYSSLFSLPVKSDWMPVTVTIHDHPRSLLADTLYRKESDSHLKNFYSSIFMKRFYKGAFSLPYLITVSEHVSNGLYDFGYRGKVLVVHPPVSDSFNYIHAKEPLRKELDLPSDKLIILSVSSEERRKNLRIIPETLSLLGNDFCLVRVGLPINNCRAFLKVSTDLLNKIYNASDVLIMPTLEEGFGSPVVEAFKSGLPTVVSDIEIMREVGGDATVFADPTSALSFASAIREAIDNSTKLREKGLARSKEFEMPRFSENLRRSYKTITDNE